jgi:hypothetical protein
MRYKLLLAEGGWVTTATQNTQIKPDTIQHTMHMLRELVSMFNEWLVQNYPDVGQVQVTTPTGSGYYHLTDDPNKEYGDIDVQMVAENPWKQGHASYTATWNSMWDVWVKQSQPDQLDAELSKPGHPFVMVPDHGLVQVDFMWQEPEKQLWGLVRSVPPPGIKGLIHGNMFSVLAQIMGMSMQYSGVQVKTQKGAPVSFSKQKDVTLHTITHDPHRMFWDLLEFVSGQPVSQLKLNTLIEKTPGIRLPRADVTDMIEGIKGLAQAFEDNQLFGTKYLHQHKNAQEFLTDFWNVYSKKAQEELLNPKRLKAETPAAKARAARDIDSIKKGLAHVKELWDHTHV